MFSLKARLAEEIGPMRERVNLLRTAHGDKVISECTISQAIGGMRSVKCMVSDISALDPMEGIKFRGYSIPEIREKLPKVAGGREPLPEGLLWLLMTGKLPTQAETAEVTAELHRRSGLPAHVLAVLDALPMNTHPMTMFIAGITAMQTQSQFAVRYHDGMRKEEYWDPAFEDAMTIIAQLPELAARIYRRKYKNSEYIAADTSLDWAGNFAHMIGLDNPDFKMLMRLYQVIHSDHEAGNVSAHTTHLVGSALTDPFLSLAAGIAGLAGPLHGLANQEVLRWVTDLQARMGVDVPTEAQLEKALWDTLNSGQVIPGFGHAVLRQTDPRYMAQREFALHNLPDDPLFRLVSMIYEIAPRVLTEHGKTKNPWPNVDAHSGCLLVHYGMTEHDYYTVLFGVSRAIGVLSNLVWSRALGFALERPKSVTTDWLLAQVQN